MGVSPRVKFHTIVCSSCGDEVRVPKDRRRFLCDNCFHGVERKVPWREVDEAITGYLIQQGIPYNRFVEHEHERG